MRTLTLIPVLVIFLFIGCQKKIQEQNNNDTSAMRFMASIHSNAEQVKGSKEKQGPKAPSNELLIKLTPEAQSKFKRRGKKGSVSATGNAELNNLNLKIGATHFEPVAVAGASSDTGAELFRWYKVSFPGKKGKDGKPAIVEAHGLKHLMKQFQSLVEIEAVEPNHRLGQCLGDGFCV